MTAHIQANGNRIFLIAGLAAGYLGLYLLFYPTTGIAVAVLISLPMAVAAWLFGLRIGVIASVVGIILNLILIHVTDAVRLTVPTVQIGLFIGCFVPFFFTVTLGLVREMSAQLSRELARREQAEYLLRQRNAELEGVYNANLQLTSSLELCPVLETILKQASSLVSAVDVDIFLYDGEKLTFGGALKEGGFQDTPFAEPRPEGLTYSVARTGRRIVIPDVNQHTFYQDHQWGGAIAGFPLSVGDRVHGVMNVAFATRHDFSESELRILELLAAQAATAIRNAHDYETTRQHAEALEERAAVRTVELKRAKESAEALLNNSFDVILLLNADGMIKQTNPAFERTFGLEQGEGRMFATLFQQEELIAERLEQLVDGRSMQQFEATARREDGQFTADMVFVPLINAGVVEEIICNLRDVTERKQAEMRQRALSHGMRKVLSVIQELITSPDMDALWKRAIEIARSELGIERCSIYVERGGYMWGTYGTSLQRETTDEHHNSYFKGEKSWQRLEEILAFDQPTWEVEYSPRMEWDGEKMNPLAPGWVALTPIHSAYRFIGVFYNDAAISGAPLDDIRQEIVAMYCSFLGSLYEHKRVEDEVRRALERERELSELKSRFTSMISHELRTPLASIQLASDLLKGYHERLSDDARTQHLNKIQMQVRHLTNLLEDVLTFTKGEQVGLLLQPKQVDLREFCSELCAEIRATNPTHRIEFCDCPGAWSACVDPKLLRQALMNLLLNAIKYSPEETTVTVALDREDRNAVIRIADQGIGIPATDLPHIFEVFYRAKNVGTAAGTGLGLALVQQIAEAHHGFVFCESQLGEGTTFIFQIPVFA